MGKAHDTGTVGDVLHDVAADYGYEHLSLTRSTRGVTTDVPWNWMPCGFAEAYFMQGWEQHDPELYYGRRTHFPFMWASLPQKMRLTTGQLQVIDAAADSGLRNGLSVPLRGPGGRLDLVSLVASHKDHGADPAKQSAAAFLALRALARFTELNDSDETPNHILAGQPPCCEVDDLINGDFAPFSLPPLHLRALALVEFGARRWTLGLTKFASSLYLLRKSKPYDDLQRWGLIADAIDDERWRFYFAPTVLGVSYLRRAPGVADILREILLREIDRRELPDGLATK